MAAMTSEDECKVLGKTLLLLAMRRGVMWGVGGGEEKEEEEEEEEEVLLRVHSFRLGISELKRRKKSVTAGQSAFFFFFLSSAGPGCVERAHLACIGSSEILKNRRRQKSGVEGRWHVTVQRQEGVRLHSGSQ
jgi:hypothetical protein